MYLRGRTSEVRPGHFPPWDVPQEGKKSQGRTSEVRPKPDRAHARPWLSEVYGTYLRMGGNSWDVPQEGGKRLGRTSEVRPQPEKNRGFGWGGPRVRRLSAESWTP